MRAAQLERNDLSSAYVCARPQNAELHRQEDRCRAPSGVRAARSDKRLAWRAAPIQRIARRASVETEESSFAFSGPLGGTPSSRSGRATAPLKIVAQHLQAIATMPARRTEGNQGALPLNFGQGQEADV